MTKEELESRFEDCFDDNTRASEGGYGADTTDRQKLWDHFCPIVLEYAKQKAIAFFKWNAQNISTYLDYLRRVDKAEGLEEMELELNHFENNSIEGRYALFAEIQSIEQQTKDK
jgi:hypothetical protein